MKNIIILIIISICISLNAFTQSNQVEVIAKQNCSEIANDVLTIDIYVKAKNAGENVSITEQNYRFGYNNAAINSPSIVTTSGGLGYNNPVISSNGSISIFDQPTLTGSQSSHVSFNIVWGGGDGLYLTNTDETYIGSISFDIINSNLPYNFIWHHFVGSEDNWPPTYIGIENLPEDATGVFNDDLDLANEIARTATHSCTVNDGSLRLDWPDKEYYYDLYVSMDGGQTFVNNPGEDEFTANDLPAENYDIRVKIGENGCVTILDDINVLDLSHEVTRAWGHPTCGQDDGWIELTWVRKLNKIDISIDGGNTYVEQIPAANEYYRFEGLTTGNYDVRVRWSWNEYECPLQLDDVNLGVQPPVSTDLSVSYNCVDDLQLNHNDIGANRYQFRYRTLSNGVWAAWKNSTHTTNISNTISNLPNLTKLKLRARVYCDSKWSGWGQTKHFNLPACKLGSDIDNALVSVYPNPANKQVTIDLEDREFENGTAIIYNLAGKQVQVENLIANQRANRLNVSGLANGAYLLKIITDGKETHLQKLTIAH